MGARGQTTTGTVVTPLETTTASVVVSTQTTTATVVVSRSAPLSSLTQPAQAIGPDCSSTTTTPDEAAFTTFLRALLELDTRNEVTPCQLPDVDHLWTSENHEEREAAGHRCQPCQLLDLCAAYAEQAGERWHTWAGHDRTALARKETSS